MHISLALHPGFKASQDFYGALCKMKLSKTPQHFKFLQKAPQTDVQLPDFLFTSAFLHRSPTPAAAWSQAGWWDRLLPRGTSRQPQPQWVGRVVASSAHPLSRAGEGKGTPASSCPPGVRPSGPTQGLTRAPSLALEPTRREGALTPQPR